MSTITGMQSTAADVAAVSACPQESPELYRFRVDQYEQMGRAGILSEDDRVELVEGVLYRKPMKKGTHSIAAREAAAALGRAIPAESYFVTREDPVRIASRAGMPEPDISVVRGRSRDYAEQPEGGDVALVVEIAEKSLNFDRTQKLTTYAGGGIPVYWIVNLIDRQVEVYTGPGPEGYRSRQVYTPGQDVPIVIDGATMGQVAVIELLP
jgi:Uma2 family endonuclease